MDRRPRGTRPRRPPPAASDPPPLRVVARPAGLPARDGSGRPARPATGAAGGARHWRQARTSRRGERQVGYRSDAGAEEQAHLDAGRDARQWAGEDRGGSSAGGDRSGDPGQRDRDVSAAAAPVPALGRPAVEHLQVVGVVLPSGAQERDPEDHRPGGAELGEDQQRRGDRSLDGRREQADVDQDSTSATAMITMARARVRRTTSASRSRPHWRTIARPAPPRRGRRTTSAAPPLVPFD